MSARSVVAAILPSVMAISLGACSRGAGSYLLTHRGNTELLVPPGVTLPVDRPLELKLRNARKLPVSLAGCEIHRDPISVEWRGTTAVVRARPGSDFLGFGQGSSNQQAASLDSRGSIGGQPIALDPLQYISRLRADLIALEASGCLRRGEGQVLAARIAEELPFQPLLSYLLRFGAFDLNEFIDLTPDFRLRIVYPVYSADNPSQTKEIEGVETVCYELVSHQNDGRVGISQTGSKNSCKDHSAPQEPQKPIASPFPSSIAFFRLFLKKGISPKDPVTVAIVLSSVDREHLENATRELDGSTEASCRAVTPSNASCTMFPPLTGVNAEIRVKVNGKDAFAELGARVDQLIHEAGDDDLPRSVRVKRLFNARLVPVRADSEKQLLALILMPGDVVNYR